MKNRIGEKHTTNEGCEIEIIEYFNKNDCTIKFENEITLKNVFYNAIKNGQIKNLFHPSVYDVGYIGQGKYCSKLENKPTKVYYIWKAMLQRCYDENIRYKRTEYKGCTVVKKWHNFQNFAKWFEENYVEGSQLDKDILFKGNKFYSFKTCCFVPREINILLTKRNIKRGEYPIGVTISKSKNRFEASLSTKEKQCYLGSFKTPEEAFRAYKKEKESYIKEMADKWKLQLTSKVYQVLYNYQVEIND